MDVTDAVGIPTPHCDDGVPVGADGNALTFKFNVLLVFVQPNAVTVQL